MTYSEFKRLEIFKTAKSIKIVDKNGIEVDDNIELNGMDVNGYLVEDGNLLLELVESIDEFE
ncbi:MAG: hypothetical protein IJA34_00615 [Lachnospiraceae bacterium]|nr:hypothetical protein [Lachnospiraceae bacterium]